MMIPGPFRAGIRAEEVYRYLGYREGKTRLTPRVERLVRSGLDLAQALLRPAAAAVDLNILETGESAVKVEVRQEEGPEASSANRPIGRAVWRSAKLARLLSGCTRATAMLVTAGPGFEAETSRLFSAGGDPVLATVIDAAGSEAAECLADEVDDLIKERAEREGFATTWRFSPGYGGWGLDVQPELVGLLNGEALGVSVTDTLMLSPQKSITAVIGWYPCPEPQEKPERLAQKCRGCEMDSCAYRRAGSGGPEPGTRNNG